MPLAASRTVNASALASDREIAAGEAGEDAVDGAELGCAHVSHALESGHVGPVSGKDLSSRLIRFYLPFHGAVTGPLHARLDPADAGEQATQGEALHAPGSAAEGCA